MKLMIKILPLLIAAHLLEAQTPIRIMPLGNSVTQADNAHLGYRYRLWLKLENEGLDFDLVGSLNTNFNGNPVFPDNDFDRDHEGHWGWRADELLSSLPAWLAGYTPDVVLMHVGTNDALQGQSVNSTIDEISDIIDALRNDNPTVTILLAKLIGTTLSQNTAIIALNNEMDALAASTNTTTSKVLVVDHYAGFNAATDTYDGIHPNELGEEKIAQKWFDAIMALESGNPPETGLTAAYYNTRDLTGPVVVSKIDPQVNYNWGSNAPTPNVNADNFSVRWTGMVEVPVTGNYVFSTLSDDGVRLWLDGTLIINNWTDHGPTTNNSATFSLVAGTQHAVRLEYYENAYGAVIGLLWSYPGQSQQPIPQTRLFPMPAGGVDTQSPSIPAGLSSSNLTTSSFLLSWNASTDNTGVTGYEIFRNGVPIGNSTVTSFSVTTGLSPGTTYSMTVRARDAAGNWSAQSNPLNVTTTPSSGDPQGTGLTAAYYNTRDLTGPVVVNKIDPQVNYNWDINAPTANVNADNFSVRWTGMVEVPVTGNYVFSTLSDDGVRLWLDGTLIINNWTDHGPTTNNSATFSLVAGTQHSVRLEYYENAYGAVIGLLWSYPGQSLQPIPQARLFPMPAGETDTQSPSIPGGLSYANLTETSFSLSWNASTDNTGVTGYEIFRNGISIGNSTVTSFSVTTGLSPGTTYGMTVRARDAAGNWSGQSSPLSVTTLQSSGNPQGAGLSAAYYNTRDLTGPVVVSKIDPQVNYDWGTNSPTANVNPDNFSVRWTGTVEAPVTGNYVFSTLSDDGVRLWLDGTLIINNWTDHGPTINNSATFSLVAGIQYAVRLEYYENAYGAMIGLLWSYPGQSQQPIPQSRLFPMPTGGADTQSPSIPGGLSYSMLTETSFQLSWNASTDNTGVTGYEVFRNGISIGTSTVTSFSVATGLSPGTTYAMTVRARDGAGNWSALSNPLNVTTPLSGEPAVNGLVASYYNNVSLTAPVALSRIDALVNFDWVYGAPAPAVQADFFSVRWEGFVEAPVDGNYTFATISDDGIRLWINGTQVINNWTDHAPTTNTSSPIPLVAGQKYSLRLEFYEKTAGAIAKLLWSYPGQVQQAIPETRLFQTSSVAMAKSASSARQQSTKTSSGWTSEEKVEIYPNPVTHDELRILLHSERDEDTEVRLVSMQATEALSMVAQVHEGQNVLSIPVSNISDGIYVLTVRSSSISLIEKVIIRRIP